MFRDADPRDPAHDVHSTAGIPEFGTRVQFPPPPLQGHLRLVVSGLIF